MALRGLQPISSYRDKGKVFLMQDTGRLVSKPHSFITSTLEDSEWAASSTGLLTPGERASFTHLTGSWVGPRAGADAL